MRDIKHLAGPCHRVVFRDLVEKVSEFEIGSASLVASLGQASAGASGSQIGGFSLIEMHQTKKGN